MYLIFIKEKRKRNKFLIFYEQIIIFLENEFGDIFRTIKNHLGKTGDQEISSEDFKNYFKKFTEVH